MPAFFCEYERFFFLVILLCWATACTYAKQGLTSKCTTSTVICWVDHRDCMFIIQLSLSFCDCTKLKKSSQKSSSRTQDSMNTHVPRVIRREPSSTVHTLHLCLSILPLIVHNRSHYSGDEVSGEFDRPSLLRTLVRELNNFNHSCRLLPLHLLLRSPSYRSS